MGASFAIPLDARRETQGLVKPVGTAVVAGLLATVADFDIAFWGMIPYAHFFGHRGFFHSPAFVACLGLCLSTAIVACGRHLRLRQWLSLSTVFVLAATSHPVLDALTNGGMGVMLLFPWSHRRHFAPWRPIDAAPIGLRAFFTSRGLRVLASELPFVLAFLAAGIAVRVVRRRVHR